MSNVTIVTGIWDIGKITAEELNALEMNDSKKIHSLEYRSYYTAAAGAEHYRLLTYISKRISNADILDIGTYKGCSALALAANHTNRVHSFCLSSQLDIEDPPSNITFNVDNILADKYQELIKKSSVILLDTMHTGTFERIFLDHIKAVGFKGILILDDIHLNNEMMSFWDDITDTKFNITSIGHCTGTGVVDI